jgi:hypothetical protein
MTPLATTFAGDSVRAEGLFSASSGPPVYLDMYVGNGNLITSINLATKTNLGTVSNTGSTYISVCSLCVDYQNKNVYAIGYGPSGYTYVVGTSTGSLSGNYGTPVQVSTGSAYWAMAINNAGTLAYVPYGNGYYIQTLNLPSLTATGTTLSLGFFPQAFTADNVNQYVYVTGGYGSISRVTTSLSSISTLTISGASGSSGAFCIDSTNTYGYVACGNGVIYQINLSTFTYTGKSYNSFYSNVTSLLVDSTGTHLYCYSTRGLSPYYGYITQYTISGSSSYTNYAYTGTQSTNDAGQNAIQHSMVFDPSGNYLYYTICGSEAVGILTISSFATATWVSGFSGQTQAISIGYNN